MHKTLVLIRELLMVIKVYCFSIIKPVTLKPHCDQDYCTYISSINPTWMLTCCGFP
jgi:hypothetical protein